MKAYRTYKSRYMVGCLGYSGSTKKYRDLRYVTSLSDEGVPNLECDREPMQFRNLTEANAVRDNLADKGWLAVSVAAPIYCHVSNDPRSSYVQKGESV